VTPITAGKSASTFPSLSLRASGACLPPRAARKIANGRGCPLHGRLRRIPCLIPVASLLRAGTRSAASKTPTDVAAPEPEVRQGGLTYSVLARIGATFTRPKTKSTRRLLLAPRRPAAGRPARQ